MTTARTHPWLALAAALTLAGGVAACTEPQQRDAEANLEAAGDELGDLARDAGDAIESGARAAGETFDEVTDNIEREIEERRAENDQTER